MSDSDEWQCYSPRQGKRKKGKVGRENMVCCAYSKYEVFVEIRHRGLKYEERPRKRSRFEPSAHKERSRMKKQQQQQQQQQTLKEYI